MDNDSIAYIEMFGVVLSGAKRPEDGLYWTDLEGWWGLPDLKTDSDSIPGANGRFSRAHHYRDSRVITLVGHILTESSSGLVSVRHRLEAALSVGYGQMTVVTDSYGSWSRMVEVDTLEIEPDHGKEWTKFTVDMVAPDPLRYQEWEVRGPVGLPVQEGGLILPKAFPWDFGNSIIQVIQVDNTGDVPIYPKMTLQGSAESVALRGGPMTLEYGDFDGTLTFDSDERRAWLDGTDVTRWMVRRDWPVIPAGDTFSFYFEAFNPSDDIALTVSYRIGAW